MPTLRPFKGVRYADQSAMGALACPPYDVISPDEQQHLHERHPHNAVRLELASTKKADEEVYERVRQLYETWLAEGVLARDTADSFYVYRQDFRGPDGSTRQVTGVLGALALEPFGQDAGVLPHERTMEGPKADRLALLRSVRVNVSPIYGIYRGGGRLSGFFDGLQERPPEARFEDASGVLHRLWRITRSAESELLASAVAAGPLVIADGHHRYETALQYHREASERGDEGDHGAILCFCVDADSEGLVVLPYNRAVRQDGADPAPVLRERFGAADLAGSPDQALAASRSPHPFVFVLPDTSLLVEVADDEVVAVTGPRHEAWRDLDVVALHEVVLPQLFDSPELRFSKDPAEVTRLVREEGWSAGVLLRALSATDVVDVARSGERMPQKASYFWPKAVTGLVFRSLD